MDVVKHSTFATQGNTLGNRQRHKKPVRDRIKDCSSEAPNSTLEHSVRHSPLNDKYPSVKATRHPIKQPSEHRYLLVSSGEHYGSSTHAIKFCNKKMLLIRLLPDAELFSMHTESGMGVTGV